MAAKYWMPAFGNEYRTAPAMRDAHTLQNRMKAANALFERAQARRGFAFANGEALETSPELPVASRGARKRFPECRDESAAENKAAAGKQAAPKIWQIDGVKRLSGREAEQSNLFASERRGGQRERQPGTGARGDWGGVDCASVRGEKDVTGGDYVPPFATTGLLFHVQLRRDGEINGANFGIFGDVNSGVLRCSCESCDDLAGVDRAARNFAYDAQMPGVEPGNR